MNTKSRSKRRRNRERGEKEDSREEGEEEIVVEAMGALQDMQEPTEKEDGSPTEKHEQDDRYAGIDISESVELSLRNDLVSHSPKKLRTLEPGMVVMYRVSPQRTRMGIYLDEDNISCVSRRPSPSSSRFGRYVVLQCGVDVFTDGSPDDLEVDDWCITNKTIPLPMIARRARSRVGTDWPLDTESEFTPAETFVLWATQERDPHPIRTQTARTYGGQDGEGGMHSPPTTQKAKTHQSNSLGHEAKKLRFTVAGTTLGCYLGGPVGIAVGATVGLFLDYTS